MVLTWQEKSLIGKYIELKDMSGWTRIRVKSGKKLISNKTKENFIQLSFKKLVNPRHIPVELRLAYPYSLHGMGRRHGEPH